MHRLVLALFGVLLSLCAHAGAWGEGSFDNDDALDWVSQCVKRGSSKLVSETLSKALAPGELESSDGSSAIAAAEVVASARGRPSPQLPPEIGAWLERQQKAELVQLASLAIRALARLKDPKNSELAQLWAEGKANTWARQVAELEGRLAK